MTQTAVVVAPGRGTYNRAELGYLHRHHADKRDLIASYDSYRKQAGQPSLTELDGAAQFRGPVHTTGNNASALIHGCAYADFLSINPDKFDIIGVTGNSMGWYIALTCAGALDPMGGMQVVNTMGGLMHRAAIGGQLVYPFVDGDWHPVRKDDILKTVATIDAREGHTLGLSIDLGGMLVLAGNEAGLSAFETAVPKVDDRFPLRLPNHAAFHTALQAPVSAEGRGLLPRALFQQPRLPLIDGRGGQWHPGASNLDALWDYTLGHQVTAPYDFTAAIQSAAHDLMPDVFILLGPGGTLGGAVGQSLCLAGWKGLNGKQDFTDRQATAPVVLSMGREDQRALVV